MKWLRRILIAAAVLVLVLVGVAVATAQRSERPVGFQLVRAAGADGRAFAVGVWYPTQARPRPTTFLGGIVMDVAPAAAVDGRALPLVVISHGNGGGPGSHADLAMALADAGYVVAAPMHSGDNFADQAAAGSVNLFSGRNRELRATVDHMLTAWPERGRIDPQRIGAFGFSAGGFTVLTAVGAAPDLRLVATQCTASPEFICDVLRHAKSPLLDAAAPGVGDAFVADPRIKAAVVAAPGLGFAMGTNGLADVRVPVQLWSGEQDDKVPYATNAKPVREALGARVEFHAVPGAGHTSFLTPCGLLRPPGLCTDPGQFDRRTFHAAMNASVVAFFDERLKPR
ncbi:alpha/beta hydrolase family protein [Lysobacter koreensis]|uniref:Alpha/beta hydrolase family protein n=1 Tax=Lysobacter koreensis TaxID=266122 RepID=A0ABW2YQQ5_9GAMM